MNKRYIVKAGAFCITIIFLLLTSPTSICVNNGNETYTITSENLEWYWKPSYRDYSPNGMPDFDQAQKNWKVIFPGKNGVLNSVPAGDDVISSDGKRIAPGNNCNLESIPAGDDVVQYGFCGPVALANCFWWFDSKFESKPGQPGDGKDTFSLVKDYGAGDDHIKGNVPLLIEKLAIATKTASEGTAIINNMQNAIDDWFDDTGLSYMFTETTYNAPTFQFVEDQIEKSQDVILLLGYYDVEGGGKLVDQQQTQISKFENIPDYPKIMWQMFIPTISVLDAVNVTLAGPVQSTITVFVYNANWQLLGSSSMQLQAIGPPTWYQFHFSNSISLIPGQPYYISLTSSAQNPSWMWFYWGGPLDNYDGPGSSSLGGVCDFAFKTEYKLTEIITRIEGHYVTCAGVYSAASKIGFSDPARNIKNPLGTDHNDAKNVSHDEHTISSVNVPISPYKWWLPNFPSGYDYTVVEQAIVICPKPSIDIDKKVWDSSAKQWVEDINADVCTNVKFNITLHNNGGYNLTNIVVIDTLPVCLEYVNGSANPHETEIIGNKIKWIFNGPLEYCNKITINFEAHVISEGVNINNVTVNANSVEGSAEDYDTAIVHAMKKRVADLECTGSLSWSRIKQGSTVYGNFIVKNVGESGSLLDWKISEYPSWGTWVFTPSEGYDLTPEAGEITVVVTLVAPKAKSISFVYNLYKTEEFTGNVTITNQENPSDKEVIPVSITVSKSKAFTYLDFYRLLIFRFPFFEKMLKQYYN